MEHEGEKYSKMVEHNNLQTKKGHLIREKRWAANLEEKKV